MSSCVFTGGAFASGIFVLIAVPRGFVATVPLRGVGGLAAALPKDEKSGFSTGSSALLLRAEEGREERLNSRTTVVAALATRGTPRSPADSRIFPVSEQQKRERVSALCEEKG